MLVLYDVFFFITISNLLQALPPGGLKTECIPFSVCPSVTHACLFLKDEKVYKAQNRRERCPSHVQFAKLLRLTFKDQGYGRKCRRYDI